MVQGLMAHFGRLDEHLQVALGLLLADVLPEGPGAQGPLVLVLPGEGGGHQGLVQLLGIKFCVGKVDCHGFTSSLSVSFSLAQSYQFSGRHPRICCGSLDLKTESLRSPPPPINVK